MTASAVAATISHRRFLPLGRGLIRAVHHDLGRSRHRKAGGGNVQLVPARIEQIVVPDAKFRGIFFQVGVNVQRRQKGEITLFEPFDVDGADIDEAGDLFDGEGLLDARLPERPDKPLKGTSVQSLIGHWKGMVFL